MSDITKRIGQQIRDTRKKRGLTQKKLGELLGVSESAVNRYESGKVNPSLEMLEKIAIALTTELKVYFDEIQ